MIDFDNYFNNIKRQKYRSTIIHHSSTEKLTNFAKKVCARYDGKYFDIAEYFKNNYETSPIDCFGISELNELLKTKSQTKDLIFVDHIGMVLATWEDQEINGFHKFIEHRWNSFHRSTKATLIFSLKTYDKLEELDISDTKNNSRIFNLSEIKNL